MIAEGKPPATIKRPIITLTSDFGSRDYFVGAVKGAIYSINPQAAVVDITHDIPAYDLLAAALTIRAAYYYYPLHTIHVVLVDPGKGPKRRPILVKTENFYFIGPDNGVFSFIYGCERLVGVWALNAAHYYAKSVNNSFLARDVYAPVAGHISRLMSADDFGEAINDFARIQLPKPEMAGNQMKGRVLMADRFGNLITNIETAELNAFMQKNGVKGFQLEIAGKKAGALSRTFGEGQGEFFPIHGPSGYLEIAAVQKSAEKLLGAARGQEFILTFG